MRFARSLFGKKDRAAPQAVLATLAGTPGPAGQGWPRPQLGSRPAQQAGLEARWKPAPRPNRAPRPDLEAPERGKSGPEARFDSRSRANRAPRPDLKASERTGRPSRAGLARLAGQGPAGPGPRPLTGLPGRPSGPAWEARGRPAPRPKRALRPVLEA